MLATPAIVSSLLLPQVLATTNIYSDGMALISPRSPKIEVTTTQPNKLKLGAILTQQGATEYETELALAIAGAESNYRNIEGVTGDAGIFQFATSTFAEICEGDPFDIEDSAECFLKEIRDNQLWRWDASREDRKNYQGWFSKLSIAAREIILRNDKLCSCVRYASNFINLPPIRTPAELKPNSPPALGAGVLLDYTIGGSHLGVLIGWTENGFKISESNFNRCKKTIREIKWNDTHLRGFYKP